MLRVVGFLVALLVAGPVFVAGPVLAQAQMACDKRVEVMTHLERKYSEAPVALGVANNGGLVELLTTKEGSTWTLIITLPTGMTCLLAAGESWEAIPATQFGEKT